MFEIPVLISLVIAILKKSAPLVNCRKKYPSLVQYNNKGTIYRSICKKSNNNLLSWKQKSQYFIPIHHGNCLCYLNSNAVIFKRITDRSSLINVCNDYRTYLC